ncbi:MAG: PDZ domain-containing protein [Gemmatimonadales bacterium]
MSKRSLVLMALGAVSLWPASAGAQEPETRERVRLRSPVRGDTVLRDRIQMVTSRRARLGVMVDMRASENDSIGATLESVTPGGPASTAGLRSGDIITRLDGQSLVLSDNRKVEPGSSVPALRLVELAARLEPNDTITIEYRRGDARRSATLVTGNEPMWEFSTGGRGAEPRVWSYRLPELDRFHEFEGRLRAERLPEGGFFSFSFGGPFAHVELAPLNADLGAYFGTTEGVLVINVPSESTLGLKGGDVVLSVDGRKVTTPSGLLRILRSYDADDSFRLEVMRNKTRQTITGKLDRAREER